MRYDKDALCSYSQQLYGGGVADGVAGDVAGGVALPPAANQRT